MLNGRQWLRNTIDCLKAMHESIRLICIAVWCKIARGILAAIIHGRKSSRSFNCIKSQASLAPTKHGSATLFAIRKHENIAAVGHITELPTSPPLHSSHFSHETPFWLMQWWVVNRADATHWHLLVPTMPISNANKKRSSFRASVHPKPAHHFSLGFIKILTTRLLPVPIHLLAIAQKHTQNFEWLQVVGTRNCEWRRICTHVHSARSFGHSVFLHNFIIIAIRSLWLVSSANRRLSR